MAPRLDSGDSYKFLFSFMNLYEKFLHVTTWFGFLGLPLKTFGTSQIRYIVQNFQDQVMIFLFYSFCVFSFVDFSLSSFFFLLTLDVIFLSLFYKENSGNINFKFFFFINTCFQYYKIPYKHSKVHIFKYRVFIQCFQVFKI